MGKVFDLNGNDLTKTDATLRVPEAPADAAEVGKRNDAQTESMKAEKSRAEGAERKLQQQVDTLNAGGLNLKEDLIRTQVDSYLTQHPEAMGTALAEETTRAKAAEEENAKGIGRLEEDYFFIRSNQKSLNIEDLDFRNIGIATNGEIIEGNYPKILISNLIRTDKITHLYMDESRLSNNNGIRVYYYDDNGNFVKSNGWGNYSALSKKIPIDSCFIRIRIDFTVDTLPSDIIGLCDFALLYNEHNVKYKTGKNLFNPADIDCVYGYIASPTGSLNSSDGYKVSGFIPVRSGEPVIISPRFRNFIAYGSDMSVISDSYIRFEQSNHVYTPSNDGYIRFSYYVNEEGMVQVEYGTERTSYEKFKYILDGIDVGSEVDLSIGNSLYGKKWAVCGDSFTAGGATADELTDDDYIKDGRYKGKLRLYKWLIANRNNMNIQDLSLGGRTMATPSDGTFTNAFSHDLYNTIDRDVDYITLYFGINDSHHRPSPTGNDGEDTSGVIPLGTIDDTSKDTFYGAWNFVMEYLIINYPHAHIGIIVSNGCETADYPNAEIEIAKKWGVPYIDLNGDERTPMMNRSTNRNASNAAKTARNEAFRISSSNGHPNSNAHEYESWFIENFLRSI